MHPPYTRSMNNPTPFHDFQHEDTSASSSIVSPRVMFPHPVSPTSCRLTLGDSRDLQKPCSLPNKLTWLQWLDKKAAGVTILHTRTLSHLTHKPTLI